MTPNEKICIACQECCRWITFVTSTPPTSKAKKHMLEFYTARGFKINDHGDHVEVSVHTTCPNLTNQGCKIYLTRPLSCKVYDGRKDNLMKDHCKLPRIK